MRQLMNAIRATAFTVCLMFPAHAFAQPAPDWRATLVELYRLDVAFDACKEILPSSSAMRRLEDAINHVEAASALQEDDLDELYEEVEREAAQQSEFCRRMADAVDRIQRIPPQYR